MTGRQRTAAAIARLPHDRVPLGCYAIDCDTAAKVLGRPTLIRNKPGLRLALWQGRRDEVADSLKQDTVDLFRKLDIVDLITFKEAQPLPPRDYDPDPPRQLSDNTYEDRQGRIWQLAWEANDVSVVHDPNPSPESFSPADFPPPDPASHCPPDPSCYEVFDHLVATFGQDRYILGHSGGLGVMPFLGGMENGLMQFALAPDAVAARARQLTSRANLDDAVAVRPGVAGVMIEEDMAGTNGLLISPRQWRDLSWPLLVERVAALKQRLAALAAPGAPPPQVVLHCCGRTIDILDLIADAGIDCYQSLQTFAGMTVDILLPRFGGRLAFWGGAPVEHLVAGTPDDIRRAVRQSLDAARGYPGFIFGPSHSIAFGTRYDNFMAMLDEFARLR